jgi:hypothetical protein
VVHAETAKVFDLPSAARRDGVSGSEFASMLSLIDAGDAGLDSARRLLERRASESDIWSALTDVDLLAPLPEPRQLRDAMAFPLHIRQAARRVRAMKALRTGGRGAFEAAIAESLEDVPAVYREVPIHFFGNRFTVIGPGAAVNWPRYSKVMDYELGAIACHNRAAVYDLLFRAAAETLVTMAADPKHLGTRSGFTAVLHTWGRR